MMSEIAQFDLDGRWCCIHRFGAANGGDCCALHIMPVMGEALDLLEGQHERLDSVVNDGKVQPFMLAVFSVPNWNNDLSPWPAPPIKKSEPDFAGNASATLDWILNCFVPEVGKRVCLPQSLGIFGYSMAGMFALWAAHQCDAFATCGSCSGSLWYEGFADFIQNNSLKSRCSVYLSLGEAEERTRNPWFSQVGNATRRVASVMEKAENVEETALVWHSGGHLGAVGERVAACQLWMAMRASRSSRSIKNVLIDTSEGFTWAKPTMDSPK